MIELTARYYTRVNIQELFCENDLMDNECTRNLLGKYNQTDSQTSLASRAKNSRN